MNISYYLQILKEYPLHTVTNKALKKIATKFMTELEALTANLFSTYISDEHLLKSLNDSIGNIYEPLIHFVNRQQPCFFFRSSEKNKMVDIIKSNYPNTIDKTIADADRICKHVFNLLGSGDVHLGKEIDWHIDFKTGWRWELKYYKKVNCRELDKPYDVKVPWELSRCQHFVTLGKAYWYTGDEKYAKEFATQIEDWIESNPPKFGVNWVCTMDVAIRAVNWIWGYYLFKDSPCLTNGFMMKFLKALLAHGRHIANNLEKSIKTSNHYLSDLVGLVYLGIMFPEFKEARKWREYGVKELIKEMHNEVYPDGVDYEASTCYHRLVTELFISATLLCLKNHSMFQNSFKDQEPSSKCFPFPDWYMQRLEKMIEFVMYYSKPNRMAPQIGDNDDGRLHILSHYGDWNKLDHTYLLSMGAVLFDNIDFKKMVEKLHEEAFWLFGIDGIDKFDITPESNIMLSSKGFINGGIYIMRHGDTYAIVDCIPNNPKAPTSHLHNSRLSFELHTMGETVIIDPGTFVYTSDVMSRNRFRSTEYHNTIMIDKHEQNIIEPYVPFSVKRKADVKVNRWETTEQYDLLDAEHTGYIDISVIHRRQFLLDKEKGDYIFKDLLFGSGTHKIEVFFHIAPTIETYFHEEIPSIVLFRFPQENLALIPFPLEFFEVSIEQSWTSYSYGVKASSNRIQYATVKQFPVSFSFLLCNSSSDKDMQKKIEYMENKLNSLQRN